MSGTGFVPLVAPVLKGVNPGIQAIQSGYLLGRASKGVGQVELIPIDAVLNRRVLPSGGVLGQVLNSGGGGRPPFWGQEILSPATTSGTASPTIILQTGNSSYNGITGTGDITLTTGDTTNASATGAAGSIILVTGAGNSGAGGKVNGGSFTVTLGDGIGGIGGGQGGFVSFLCGDGYSGGSFTVVAGRTLAPGAGGAVSLTAGSSANYSGGDVSLTAGAAGATLNGNGGNIVLTPTAGAGSGVLGTVQIKGVLNFYQQTAPASPAAGAYSMYMDSADAHLKIKDSAGTVYDLTVAGATAGTVPVPVASGGTGDTTLTNHSVLLGQGTSAIAFATVGTANRVLADNGAAADPTFKTLTALLDAAFGSTQGQMLRRNATVWVAETSPLDTPCFFASTPTASAFIRVALTRGLSVASGAAGCYALAKTASTGNVSFTINQVTAGVATSRGTIAFNITATGVFTISSTITFAAGDMLEIVAPTTPDATLADIAITLQGTRT